MQEIERKYLVEGESWREGIEASFPISQGYLDVHGGATVRVRVKGEKAFLTIKGPSQGISRSEFEYGIPVEEAIEMIAQFCTSRCVEKIRHQVHVAGKLWVVDEFHGHNAGLVMAEIELESVDEKFELPPWAGRDVSLDAAYYNVNLAKFSE